MKELNIRIKNLTYYLVSLFYKTDCKYSCTKTKISKMLSILAFKYANDGILLFDDEVRKYDNCGTIINGSAFWVYLDEYICDKDENNKKYINDELREPMDLPPGIYRRYKQICRYSDIPLYLKKEVEELFRCFGAYSQSDLSEVLNPIVDKLTVESYGVIDLSKISSIIDEMPEDNEVVNYLKGNILVNDKILVKKIRKV